ncbi:periplasmic binding protein/LacI transcriptional regulator [Chthoniobacter flavus Ellin428]|uniref:Periplasmic binding protein/LacI transcriptional regulator n=1 Tax=Chthoniobacter flavus Ellin428 TaxID=497964 RepID=B4CUB2_9BACT|nr:sugar ABC transporter substrate-binding protein [Chthoniobacter flavus]EDY22150.1 periplasmic binding protein/LacI transcriptional regulator [Chthoniobacter flavus Ellin428]TCO94817.1 monosaccharide ABC transporter substrate-binding protein (CUT2 family) [Chthoniobacter flavus]
MNRQPAAFLSSARRPPFPFLRRLLLCSLIVLVGCEKKPAPDTAGAAGSRFFAVSFQTLNNPFFVDLNDGLKQVIDEHGDRLVTLDAQFSSLKQKNDLSDVIEQKPAAIFLNPVNWESVRATLIAARNAKIPVIVVDAPVPDADLVLAQVASDNVAAGRLAAQALGDARPQAKVAILQYSVNKACVDRVAGFTDVLAKSFPGATIIARQDVKGTSEATRPVMRDLLGRFPDLDAVFPINDPGAIGCVSAIDAAGRSGKVLVVTVDGSREAAQFILNGGIHSTSAQFPKKIGSLAAGAAYDHLAGKPVDKEIKVPVTLVTKANAAEFVK